MGKKRRGRIPDDAHSVDFMNRNTCCFLFVDIIGTLFERGSVNKPNENEGKMMDLPKWFTRLNQSPKEIRLLVTLLIAAAGGAVFTLIHFPLAWMLGSFVSSVICILLGLDKMWIPSWFRKTGLIIVGVALGLRLTTDIWQTMTEHVGQMLVATVLTIVFGLLNAWMVHKVHKVDVATSLFSNIPGGLSEMVTIGQSQGGNIQIISMFHSTRIVMIVFLTPFVVTLLPHQSVSPRIHSEVHVLGSIETLGLLALGAVGAIVASRFTIPAPFLLGPMLLTSIVSLCTALSKGSPSLAGVIVNMAQILIGISIGGEFKRESVVHFRKLFFSGFVHALLLSIMSISLAVVLSYTTGIDLVTSILATAPGGIAEMTLTALAIGSDPLLVTGFQLFRVLFILTVFSYCVRWLIKRVKSRPPENGQRA
jgi:membrane AbrB-like protein